MLHAFVRSRNGVRIGVSIGFRCVGVVDVLLIQCTRGDNQSSCVFVGRVVVLSECFDEIRTAIRNLNVGIRWRVAGRWRERDPSCRIGWFVDENKQQTERIFEFVTAKNSC